MQFFSKCPDTEELFTALQKFCAFTLNPNPKEIFSDQHPRVETLEV